MNCFLFKGLNSEEETMLKGMLNNPITLPKGTELYKNNAIGILCSGKATVYRKGDSGKEIAIRSIDEGEIFGSASLFGCWKEGLSSIIADGKCSIIYISENSFKEIITAFPRVSINYIAYLTDRIRFLNQRIDTFTADSTENRIYEFLHSLSDDEGFIENEFSMAELARRLKIGRSSLYRGIESLEKKGLLLRNNHSFQIKNNI